MNTVEGKNKKIKRLIVANRSWWMRKASRTKELNVKAWRAEGLKCWQLVYSETSVGAQIQIRKRMSTSLRVWTPDVHFHCAPVRILHWRLLETYQQIPGSLLRGSVYTGRDDIWECLLERCGAVHVFLWGWSGPARSSPSSHPTSKTQRGRNGFLSHCKNAPRLGVVVSSSPAVCSWCALERAAAGLSWRSPAGGRQGPAVFGAYCPRWSPPSPVEGSKHHTKWSQASRVTQKCNEGFHSEEWSSNFVLFFTHTHTHQQLC